jgi:hypothetical protein
MEGRVWWENHKSSELELNESSYITALLLSCAFANTFTFAEPAARWSDFVC